MKKSEHPLRVFGALFRRAGLPLAVLAMAGGAFAVGARAA
jgi:hypothetical protein